jgi:hypothetical protein
VSQWDWREEMIKITELELQNMGKDLGDLEKLGIW